MSVSETDEYHRAKSAAHYAKYKTLYNERFKKRWAEGREILDAHKAGGCVLCFETELTVLDFHHLSDKDVNVSTMLAMSRDRILKEIAKCIVLCANCHRRVHAGLITIVP